MSDRELLARLCAGPVPGAALAASMGISRAAVWKRIESLRAAGVEIEAVPGRGYALARPLELLDAVALRAALSPAATAELAGLDVLFEVDSTNAEALRQAAPVHGTRAWLAERQSAGRGRRGRAWASPLAAHIYLSLSRRFEGGIAALQGLSLAVGAAAAGALRGLGYDGVGLKWPNDLLAEGRKLGGILVEVRGDATGPLHVVVGLGINVAMPAPVAAAIDQPWCDLAGLEGPAPSRMALCVALLDALLPLMAGYERAGFAPWREAWSRLDVLAGRRVRVEEGGRWIEGIAEGLAPDGALRLRTEHGEHLCHAGETSLRAA